MTDYCDRCVEASDMGKSTSDVDVRDVWIWMAQEKRRGGEDI